MEFVEEYTDHPQVHVHYIDAEAAGQKCAPVSHLLCPTLDEQTAFSVLLSHLSNLPQFVGEVISCNFEFRQRYFKKIQNRVIDKMLFSDFDNAQ